MEQGFYPESLRSRKSRPAFHSGASVVESAIVILLVVIAIVGSFDIFNLVRVQAALERAAQESARTLALYNSTEANARHVALGFLQSAQLGNLNAQVVAEKTTDTVKVKITADVKTFVFGRRHLSQEVVVPAEK